MVIILRFLSLKTIIFTSLALSLTGCSALHGSFEQRSQQLATGIQKAYQVQPETASRVAPLIIENAQQQNLSPLILAALIQQESSYRSHVISPAGAVGLTQVMPRYWQTSCPGDLYNEAINVACGSYILAKYQQSSGSLKKALAYYNVGPSGYENSWKIKRQGKKYAKQVQQHKKRLNANL